MTAVFMSSASAAMMGGSAAVVSITNQSVTQTAALAANTVAGYRTNASGIAERRNGTDYTTLETWLLSGAAGDYDVRATLTAGALSSGTTGTWLDMGTSREWYCQDSIVDGTPVTATLTIEIRDGTSLVVLDSATITLSSERI